MAAGDHLVVSYGLYTHHGVDLGDGTVVGRSRRQACVTRDTLAEFSEGRSVQVRKYDLCDSPEVVRQRALSRVGEQGYDLVTNNCEHFATWCLTGHSASAQVRSVQRRITAAKSKAALRATARSVARSSTRLGAKSVARAATPWLLAADAVQLGVEAAAGCRGCDPHQAERLGSRAGLLSSVGIGALAGGPLGAGVGLGLWALGEAAGNLPVNQLPTKDTSRLG